ncbi:MAG: dUTP diphosphatase [Solirubrobacteraceae bacterium]
MTCAAIDELAIQLLRPGAQPPRRTRPGDAGLDLHCVDAFRLAPGERAKVGTGVAIALPEQVCALVVPRSGLACNDGVAPFLGLVDPNFRGELGVTLLNTSATEFVAAAGERIAQLLLLPFWAPMLRVVEQLGPAPDERGTDGWGSSGRA